MVRRPGESTITMRSAYTARRVKPHETRLQPLRKRSPFSARLTVDVTPDLRARIKIAAFEHGVTAVYMPRVLPLKSLPRTNGGRR